MLIENKKTISFILVFILTLAADGATKHWALSNLLAAGQKVNFLSLGLHFNRGISFSLLARHPWGGWLAAAVSVGFLGTLCAGSETIRSSSGMPLLWAGALGNLIDRVLYGYVVDWIYVGIFVNLADLWLCLGLVLFAKHFFTADIFSPKPLHLDSRRDDTVK
ncbi:MAG: signal peptidase II [Synergistaceae bacterium]|nr:signal peptidase II [Synergistaceae bacterium]